MFPNKYSGQLYKMKSRKTGSLVCTKRLTVAKKLINQGCEVRLVTLDALKSTENVVS